MGAVPSEANLLDVAPTVLHLLGVCVPDDLDGRILTELLDQKPALASPRPVFAPALAGVTGDPGEPESSRYTEEEDAAVKRRLADLGYL